MSKVTAKEAIKYYEYGITHDIFKEPVTSYARLAIESLSTERPKGRWVRKPNVLGTDYYGHCSECDCTDPWGQTSRGKPNYCTNCGMTHKCVIRTPDFCPNCGADCRESE